jgi:hypothetical protein
LHTISTEMITADRTNRIILSSLLGVSIFLLLDCYVLPLDTSKGVIVTKTEQSMSRLRIAVFRIQTERGLITVPPLAYRNTRVNDTIEIGRSFLTHIVQRVAVYRKGNAYNWRIGFISLGGFDFLALIIAANGSFLFFIYRKLEKAQMKRDLTFFLLFLSSIFFLFYFLFE